MTRYEISSLLGALGIALALAGAARAEQPAEIPHHLESFRLDSGLHRGLATPLAPPRRYFRTTVRAQGAAWLQLRFGSWELGPESFLVMTSRGDGALQILDARSLERWGGRSAFLNGEAVDVELWIGGRGSRGRFEIVELMVGDHGPPRYEGGVGEETICGTTDDRVPSNDPGVGRIVPIGCTGWAVSNGGFLSAGHCMGSGFTTIEFNVPASASNGTIRHPPPADQYPIGTVTGVNGGIGNDWTVFDVPPHPTTGLTPVQAYGGFLRMSRDTAPSTVRVTGYGVDTGTANQTQQTHTGPYIGETVSGPSVVYHDYRVDTMGGNSGSPIIASDASRLTIGIHTHGGCTSTGGANHGTSFENDSLENAIHTFRGSAVTYVDGGHPVAFEDGTVLRPYDTVLEGLQAVATVK
jgi:V8-like Glu-specific endopeptidase